VLGGSTSNQAATTIVNTIGYVDITLAVVFLSLTISALRDQPIAYSPRATYLFGSAMVWRFLTALSRFTAVTNGKEVWDVVERGPNYFLPATSSRRSPRGTAGRGGKAEQLTARPTASRHHGRARSSASSARTWSARSRCVFETRASTPDVSVRSLATASRSSRASSSQACARRQAARAPVQPADCLLMKLALELENDAFVAAIERVADAIALLPTEDDRARGIGEHALAVPMDYEQPPARKHDLRHLIPLIHTDGRPPRRAAQLHDLDNRRIKEDRCVHHAEKKEASSSATDPGWSSGRK
jgi:hypothetical protein